MLAGCATSHTRLLGVADQLNTEASKPDYNLSIVSGFAGDLKKEDFSGNALSGYSDAELGRLYTALANTTFLFPENDDYVLMQENLFLVKSERGIRLKSDIDDMYSAYLEARMFDKAAALKKRFPEMKLYSMPEKIISNNPPRATRWRVYDVSDKGGTIELKELPLEHGPRVVMLMLPGCGVAEEAMKRILADPELEPVFRQHGVVMTKRMNAESVALWRSHFSFPEVYLAYKASDFPGFDFGSSPNFYFLENGKIKYSFSGWGSSTIPDYGKTRMLKGLPAISISTTASAAQ